MGPIRNLTGMIQDVRDQASEVNNFVVRLRAANKRLTGSTGETPTPIQSGIIGTPPKEPDQPLMIQLATEIEKFNVAITDLRAEIAYMENFSETSDARDKVPTTYGLGQATAAVPWATLGR